jgi:hypothetical protein
MAATKRQKQLKAIVEADLERLDEELQDKTLPERRMILEREGVVDLMMATWDMRSTVCSRWFGQRKKNGDRTELPIPCKDGKRRWKRKTDCSEEQLEMYEKQEYIPQAKKVVNATNQLRDERSGSGNHSYLRLVDDIP